MKRTGMKLNLLCLQHMNVRLVRHENTQLVSLQRSTAKTNSEDAVVFGRTPTCLSSSEVLHSCPRPPSDIDSSESKASLVSILLGVCD